MTRYTRYMKEEMERGGSGMMKNTNYTNWVASQDERDFVDQKDVTASTGHANTFVTEASDLGLRGWPTQLKTNIGNGSLFKRITAKKDAEGDLVYVRYRQDNGADLIVYND